MGAALSHCGPASVKQLLPVDHPAAATDRLAATRLLHLRSDLSAVYLAVAFVVPVCARALRVAPRRLSTSSRTASFCDEALRTDSSTRLLTAAIMVSSSSLSAQHRMSHEPSGRLTYHRRAVGGLVGWIDMRRLRLGGATRAASSPSIASSEPPLAFRVALDRVAKMDYGPQNNAQTQNNKDDDFYGCHSGKLPRSGGPEPDPDALAQHPARPRHKLSATREQRGHPRS